MRSQQNFALVPKISSKSAQYWRKELRALLLPVLKKRTAGTFDPILQKYRHMNGDYYANFLGQKSRPKIRENWPQLLEASVLILRKKARSHNAQTIKILFTDYKWEALSHPASLSGYESSVFRSLRETERTAAWPRISVSRNTNSAVIRRKRQVTKWAIKW